MVEGTPPAQAYELGGNIRTAGETSAYTMGEGENPTTPLHANRNSGGEVLDLTRLSAAVASPPTFGATALRFGEN